MSCSRKRIFGHRTPTNITTDCTENAEYSEELDYTEDDISSDFSLLETIEKNNYYKNDDIYFDDNVPLSFDDIYVIIIMNNKHIKKSLRVQQSRRV